MTILRNVDPDAWKDAIPQKAFSKWTRCMENDTKIMKTLNLTLSAAYLAGSSAAKKSTLI